MTWISFCVGRGIFIFSKGVFDKPFDHQLLIFVIALIIAIVFFLIALILYILNIIRGIKILLKISDLYINLLREFYTPF